MKGDDARPEGGNGRRRRAAGEVRLGIAQCGPRPPCRFRYACKKPPKGRLCGVDRPRLAASMPLDELLWGRCQDKGIPLARRRFRSCIGRRWLSVCREAGGTPCSSVPGGNARRWGHRVSNPSRGRSGRVLAPLKREPCAVGKLIRHTHAALAYRWWSPPTRGSATTRPTAGGSTVRRRGASPASDMCGRSAL